MVQIMQSIPVAIIILIIGFVFLIKGADLFVEGSSSVAKRLKVPSVIIGLTIVAMGTSLPETAVSVSASLQGNNTLAISNAIGSNIFNLMVVIGVCAIMTAIPVDRSTNKRDFPISIVSAVILLLLGIISMVLGRVDGIILLVLFCIYIFLTIREAINIRKQNKDIIISESVEEAEEIKILPVGRCVLYILIGMIGIVLGGDLVVQSATVIATGIGISQTLIGLTIVSVGTSLPELVTSVVAARKKEIGNNKTTPSQKIRYAEFVSSAIKENKSITLNTSIIIYTINAFSLNQYGSITTNAICRINKNRIVAALIIVF